MTRRFWFLTTVVVAGAASIHLAGEYVADHPTSRIGHYTGTAYSFAAECNPVVRLHQAFTRGTDKALHWVARSRSSAPETTFAIPPDPEPLGQTCPAGRPSCPNFTPADVMALLNPGALLLRHDGVVTGCPATTPKPETLPHARLLEPQMLASTKEEGGAEESEEGGRTMPPCPDDDADVPAAMPHVEDEGAAARDDALTDFWIGLFRDAVKLNGRSEEAESVHDEEPPACKEDPAYHYQYPGCPYSGACPYSGRCPPPAEEEETPAKTEEKPPSTETSGPACTHKHSCHKANSSRQPAAETGANEEDEEAPVHQDIDTTEFRPSDAHEGEFDNHPM